MIYFRTKQDLEFVQEFFTLAEEFWFLDDVRDSHRHTRRGSQFDEEKYQQVRASVSQRTPRIASIARNHRVHADLQSYPAPAVGGPVVGVNLFYAILNDDSHGGVDRQRIVDVTNELIGTLSEAKRKQFLQVINPFFWLGAAIELVLSIPFWLLSKTGFDVAKIEDNLWGKLFKVAEVVLISYLAVKYGIDLKN